VNFPVIPGRAERREPGIQNPGAARMDSGFAHPLIPVPACAGTGSSGNPEPKMKANSMALGPRFRGDERRKPRTPSVSA